jgi:hypothetical protein
LPQQGAFIRLLLNRKPNATTATSTSKRPVIGTNVRKTPHTAHKGGSREVSHVQKFNKQAGWREKMVQQLLSAGLALSSIWKKARARDRQREVVGDKGQWALIFKG